MKNSNRFYEYNEDIYFLVARCVKASMSNEYDKCLVIETQYRFTFCIPVRKEYSNLNEDLRYNLYLDLQTGNPVLIEEYTDYIYKSDTDLDYIFKFRSCYSDRKMAIYLTEETKDDYRFYAYVGYLDAVFSGEYEGEIDGFLDTLDGSNIILSYVYVGASVLIEDDSPFDLVTGIDGLNFVLNSRKGVYNICDIKALV